jgi:asparagine synthase (glutamine-hydrolysing)
MCGIAGIFAFRDAAPNVSSDELAAIRDAMKARGPDGYGSWLSRDRRVGLAHRRLAIIDLSDRASQPMHIDGGRYVITFNGEIYNYKALRTGLERRGHVFATTSDTEVLVRMYAEHGPEMLRDLRGMFAFGIWDARRRGVFLARDTYGIKPLYYAREGGVLRFASQVKALVAGEGLSKAKSAAGRVGFFLWGSVPEPFTTYEAIHALPAGSYLWADENGVGEPQTYQSVASLWSEAAECALEPRHRMHGDSEAIDAALRDSVRHHLVADVPVSMFLSGGVDSGALAGLMAEVQPGVLHGITLGFAEFDQRGDDEVPGAREIAAHYAIEHHVRRVDAAEFESDLPSILSAMDQPSIDGVNAWFVSKATAELGLKVAVSGLGGDELFGGYASFREVPALVRALGWTTVLPGAGTLARVVASNEIAAKLRVHPKVAGLLEYGSRYPGAYMLKRALFMPWELDQVMPADVVREGVAVLDPPQRLFAMLRRAPTHPHAIVSTLEASQYMRNQLLRDMDWASMAHGLEVRVPLVDPVLLRALGPSLLYAASLNGKAKLAAAPRPPLPESVLARGKTGFSTPVSSWLLAGSKLGDWRRVPLLKRQDCPWARRWGYVVAEHASQAG